MKTSILLAAWVLWAAGCTSPGGAADAGGALDGNSGTALPDASPGDASAAPPDAHVDELDAGALSMDAAGTADSGMADAGPPLTAMARAYFDLHVRPVLLNPENLCVNCHTAAYGLPRGINFLEVTGQASTYDSVMSWHSESGARLIDVNESPATMPSGSVLFGFGSHGLNGVAPAFPLAELATAREWILLERSACLERGDCPPVLDAGVDGGL